MVKVDMGSASRDGFEGEDGVAVARHALLALVARDELAIDGGGQRGRRLVERRDQRGQRRAVLQLVWVVVESDGNHASGSRAVSTRPGAISQPWRNRPLMRVKP